MVIFGGFMGGRTEGGYSNAIYEYDFAKNQWNILFKNTEIEMEESEKKGIPQGRMSHASAIYKDALYTFGGFCGESKLNDLWKFDLLNKKWEKLDPTVLKPEVKSCSEGGIDGLWYY